MPNLIPDDRCRAALPSFQAHHPQRDVTGALRGTRTVARRPSSAVTTIRSLVSAPASCASSMIAGDASPRGTSTPAIVTRAHDATAMGIRRICR
jgi:hypothetical protein